MKKDMTISYLGIGLCFGITFGLIYNNLAIGMCIGLAIVAIIDLVITMDRVEKRHTIIMLLVVVIVIDLSINLLVYKALLNKSYKNEAIERGEAIYLNEKKYYSCSLNENYTISNILICETDSGKKIYEIKEYPNYEYIAVYTAWDGTIYKKE